MKFCPYFIHFLSCPVNIWYRRNPLWFNNEFLENQHSERPTLLRGMNEFGSIFYTQLQLAEFWYEVFAHSAIELCELHKSWCRECSTCLTCVKECNLCVHSNCTTFCNYTKPWDILSHATCSSFIYSKLEVAVLIDSLDAKLNDAGGIYISCNIFMVAVQMKGVCCFYTMYLNSFFMKFQRNVLPPPPSWGHNISTPVTGWGPEEGHFKNSQIPYYPLFPLLYLWLPISLKPSHITNKFSSTTSLKHPRGPIWSPFTWRQYMPAKCQKIQSSLWCKNALWMLNENWLSMGAKHGEQQNCINTNQGHNYQYEECKCQKTNF